MSSRRVRKITAVQIGYYYVAACAAAAVMYRGETAFFFLVCFIANTTMYITQRSSINPTARFIGDYVRSFYFILSNWFLVCIFFFFDNYFDDA